jgi:hypothetical protein
MVLQGAHSMLTTGTFDMNHNIKSKWITEETEMCQTKFGTNNISTTTVRACERWTWTFLASGHTTLFFSEQSFQWSYEAELEV